MNGPMALTLSVLGAASLLFVSGKVRSDLVALCAMLALMLGNVLTPSEGLSGFSNSVVIMMIGLFVVGQGILQTGLAKIASRKMLQLAGTSETRLLLMVMLVTSAIGAFVSNTGTVAMLLPIVVSLAASAQLHPGRLLMPLAFASSMGGMLTLIGTPPNLIIQDTLTAAGYGKLSFFAFTPIGIVCIVVGVLSFLFLRRFLPRHRGGEGTPGASRSLRELARKYQLSQNLFRVQVTEGSPLCNRTLLELDIPSRYGLSVLEIRRKLSMKNQFFKTINQEIAGPQSVVQPGDILYVNGPVENVQTLVDSCGLRFMEPHAPERLVPSGEDPYVTRDVGIAEVMLTPHSRLIGKLVKQSGFREKYRVNILAIQRRDRSIFHHLKDEKMRFGDALLVQGSWADIQLLAEDQQDVVVTGQPHAEADRVTMDLKAPVSAGVLLLMVLLLVTEWVPAVAAIMIAAILMVALGCVRGMGDAYKSVNWESVVLIGAMLPMSIAIEKTGAAALLAGGLVQSFGSIGPLALLAGIYFTTSLLTLFISNSACTVLLAPIALSAAVQLDVSPYPYLFAVAVSASMCFASPFSTPPNALVMSAGRYTFMDYVKVGLPLQLIMGIVMLLVLPLLFPFTS